MSKTVQYVIVSMFIGIIGLAVYTILFQNETIVKYSDLDHIRYEEIFDQNHDEYIVYYYSPFCGTCTQIKPDILRYAEKGNLPFYVINKEVDNNEDMVSPVENAIGTTIYSELKVTSTPTVLLIKDGVVTELIKGVDIVDYLSTK